jgi:hypothetical protein
VALREYKDGEGVTWRVWSVSPSAISETGETVLPGDYQTGWLCFDSGAEKRRLTPVPQSWEKRSERELDVLRRAAAVVR